ncbi:hypothetical protein E2C01_030170 [Portunus trituberculatus]|uniref:Uncharacterized protein n=1 Tax=Portunus trituberculatus TaxID=210409 RepID=A0A5B7ERD1_PORTR|nr:hypothetical protein [Portunus trituberculatus]
MIFLTVLYYLMCRNFVPFCVLDGVDKHSLSASRFTTDINGTRRLGPGQGGNGRRPRQVAPQLVPSSSASRVAGQCSVSCAAPGPPFCSVFNL